MRLRGRIVHLARRGSGDEAPKAWSVLLSKPACGTRQDRLRRSRARHHRLVCRRPGRAGGGHTLGTCGIEFRAHPRCRVLPRVAIAGRSGHGRLASDAPQALLELGQQSFHFSHKVNPGACRSGMGAWMTTTVWPAKPTCKQKSRLQQRPWAQAMPAAALSRLRMRGRASLAAASEAHRRLAQGTDVTVRGGRHALATNTRSCRRLL